MSTLNENKFPLDHSRTRDTAVEVQAGQSPFEDLPSHKGEPHVTFTEASTTSTITTLEMVDEDVELAVTETR